MIKPQMCHLFKNSKVHHFTLYDMKNELSLQVKDDIKSVCELHEEDKILTPKS
jgi:hypothetical protein